MSEVLQSTPVEEIGTLVLEVRQAYQTLKSHPVEYRKTQLKNMSRMITENMEALAQAIYKDLRKPRNELEIMETGVVTTEIVEALAHIKEWAAVAKPKVPLFNSADGCQIRPEPLGVVLVIGAWNYPLQLCLLPMVGAIAAGNAVILKPSEVSPHTAQVLAELFPKYLDKDLFRVVNGGVAETTRLLEERFDYILYTGNGTVGRIIMAAAAKHLTPVCLELGGKSPVVVLDDANPVIAGRRIAWGRFLNSGQTCIAPDYVLCSPAMQEKLVPQIAAAVKEFYGEDPQKSNSYGRMVNANHFRRVAGLVDKDKVAFGGQMDEADLYIAPTVLTGIPADSPVMQQEIFGPILPIINVGTMEEAIAFVNSRDKPLALYVFGKSKTHLGRVISSTSSGSVATNDTIVQASVPALPFGGVGASGMGAYHGKHGFDLFTHYRSTMLKKQNLESAQGMRYPPYTSKKMGMIRRLIIKSTN